jgi:hypothetical protein
MDWQKLQRIDLRILYVLILLALLIPMFRPMGLPISISENTRKVFDAIEKVPNGGAILISHDTGPGNAPELNPMLAAVARQAFRRNCRIVAMCLFEETVSPQFIMDYIGPVAQEMGKEYGEDWVNLGYKIQATQTIRLMVDDISAGAAGKDWSGKPLTGYPIMAKVKSIRNDIALMFVTTVGTPGYGEWMTYVAEPLNKPLTGGASLTMYSGIQQYIRSGQLKGFLGGLRGAAEYELLVGAPAKGLAGMDAQSLGHIIVIAFIVLGNIGYFVTRKKRAGG